MIRAASRVPLEQLLELWFEHGVAKPWMVSAAILQGTRGESVGFYDGEFLVAAAVLYPSTADTYELVFACRPEASAVMLSIVRHARLTITRLPDDVRIRALCRRDNRAGRRLAWLIGLRPAGISGDFKRYEHGHGQIRRRRQIAVHRSRH